MKPAVSMNLKDILRAANQWFSDTPERSLDQAYRAALMIKAIEDEHFNGKKICANSSNHSSSVISYFEADLKKYLNIIKVRLAEFKVTRSVLSNSQSRGIANTTIKAIENPAQYYPLELNEKQSIIIEKLNFVDEIVSKYTEKKKVSASASLVPISQTKQNQVMTTDLNQVVINDAKAEPRSLPKRVISKNGVVANIEPLSDKTGVLPRSILRTFTRIQQELDPQAEEEVVKSFRSSKLKTIISLKFILTLIIVPILTQQVAKNLLVSPIIDQWKTEAEPVAYLNLDMEEEAMEELHRFKEKLEFKNLILSAPKLSQEEIEDEIRERATELNEEFHQRGKNAIKNIFADLLALIAFSLVIFNSKQDIVVLKSFMDDIVYGLSDSAKAFIIILFTDMFVGFHSPHGWEVVLEGISKHLGIPENRDFIFLFIATFPVILDSVIKYWIFRYLNRVSPSAVATYRNMNE
ncbi:MAG TPA: proton extrusion protein PcxA [Coleofasciculaceae cyanobacterium]